MNRANRPRLSRISGSSVASKLLGRAGDGSTLTLDFTTGQLDPRLTFTRDGGGTYIGNDGRVYGMDFATSSSLAIGMGSKSVTLTATAGVDRRYLVGQTVWISNGANNMRGPVTAYDASTQVLTIDATGTSGSGSFTSWAVGNASPRFDYDPTTLAPKGLLIEGTATNLFQQSADWTVSPWTKPAQITWDGTTYATAPDGTTSAKQITVTGGASASISQAVTTGTNRTISLWIRAGSLTSFSVGAFDSAGTTWGNNADSTCSIISGPGNAPVQQVGGLWSITGLSTTQWTRVQIFRSTTYTNLLAYPGSSSGTINGTAYAWGFQMEAGNGASSLIPTGASQATRNADTAIIAAGANFTSWYQGGTQGTFYADWFGGQRPGASGSTNRTVLSTDDVSTRHLHLVQTAAAGNLRVADFGGSNNVTTSNTLTSGARTKGAFSYNGSTANVCLNGGTVATGSSLAFSATPTWLVIGGTSTNGTSITDANVLLNNSIRTIKYWPAVLPNSTLQALTA